MDYCASRGTACASNTMRDVSSAAYPAFAAPTPINLSRGYTANTLTPGAIPSPLNFPSITPPSSPYSLYGLYSPTGAPSTMYDPAYLRRLKSNPMFRDLQSLLQQECLQMQVPASLITTSWNLMELHDNTSTTNNSADQAPPTGPTNQGQQPIRGQQVYLQHMKLQDKLLKVRIDPAISADGLLVENEYSKEVGRVEMERYRALHSCSENAVKDTINNYYDKERRALANSTEETLDRLIVKAEDMRAAAQKSNTMVPSVQSTRTSCAMLKQGEQLSMAAQGGVQQGASLLLQPAEEGKNTAVRKLKFNIQDGPENDETRNEEEDNDYLNGSVNSEDFDIDEIDVETVDKDDNPCQPASESSSYVEPASHETQSESEDLLQQCLQESGITANSDTKGNDYSFNIDKLIAESSPLDQSHSQQSLTSMSHNNTADSILPDSSTVDSPMSLDSADSAGHNTSDSSSASKDPSIPEMPTVMRTSQENGSNTRLPAQVPSVSPFYNFLAHTGSSTPINMAQKFQMTNDNINIALSQMGKLCSRQAVSFTPEMRRDTTPSSWIPDTTKFSPLSMLNSSVPSLYDNQEKCTAGPSYPWNHPVYSQTGNDVKSEASTTTTERSRKRKSPCGESTADLQNNNVFNNSIHTTNNNVSSAIQETSEDLKSVPKNVVFRTRGSLTAQATNVLSQWYHCHISYPYPSDEDVQQLAAATGITERQVKKWMANKRVRCFNTLSITGNQHPIKHKYKGQGRKKKATGSDAKNDADEKENCDSRTQDKSANYSVMTEEAKQQLNQWYEEHLHNPYPTEEEKQQLANKCNISLGQIKSWFANKRNRMNNTRRQVPNYFINKFPEYCPLVQMVGQRREEERLLKRRKLNEHMYIQPSFYF